MFVFGQMTDAGWWGSRESIAGRRGWIVTINRDGRKVVWSGATTY